MFKKFEDLTFADHYIFEKVLHENQDICQELLERLLKIKIDHITYPEIEKTISPYYETKGVRLDVYIKVNLKSLSALISPIQKYDSPSKVNICSAASRFQPQAIAPIG